MFVYMSYTTKPLYSWEVAYKSSSEGSTCRSVSLWANKEVQGWSTFFSVIFFYIIIIAASLLYSLFLFPQMFTMSECV